jgi:antitoxin (DNA-binding transcriptional repressor) of toxin-antitoxin stability system
MATVHIPESEALADFPTLLARARAGEELIIDSENGPAVVLRQSVSDTRASISDSIRRLSDQGSNTTLDGSFEALLNEAIERHQHDTLDTKWE